MTPAPTCGRPATGSSALLDASARRRRRWPASGPRSWCGWSSTSTAPGWSGCWSSCTTRARSTTTLLDRARRRRAGRQPAARARPAPDDVDDAGRAGAGRRCGRTSARTAATSSCSDVDRRRASSGCGCWAAATAARRRRSRSSSRSRARSRRPRPRSPASRSSERPAAPPAPVIPVDRAAVAARTPAAQAAASWTPVAGSTSWQPARSRRFAVDGHADVAASPGRRRPVRLPRRVRPAAGGAWPGRRSRAGSAARPASAVLRCPALPARTSTSAGPARGLDDDRRCTSSRCRCWPRRRRRRSRVPAAVGRHERQSPGDVRPGGAAPDRPGRPAPAPASAARCAPSRSPTQHQHVVDLVEPRADVHLPALLPAVHRRRRRSCATGRCPTATCPSPTSVLGRAAVGRAGDPGRAGVLLPQLGAGPDGRLLSRARPAPPSPSCRSAPGTRRGGQPGAAHARARRRGAAGPHAGPARDARRPVTWCRSTRCYELVGAAAHGLARLRRRPGGRGRCSTPSSPSWPRAAGPARGEVRRHDRAVVHRRRHRRRAVRRRPEPARPAAGRGDHRRRRARLALRARSGSSRSAAATTTPRSRRCSTCSATATRFAQTLKPFAWLHASTVAQGFTGATEVDLPLPCTYDFEVARHQVPARPAGRRDPAAVPVQRHGVHPRRRPASRSSRCRGTREARYRLPVAVWRDLMDVVLPRHRVAADAPGHRRGARALPARPRPHQLGRRRDRAARRGDSRAEERAVTLALARLGRRRRPLRGVPALSLPVDRGQEPGPLAVRRARPARRGRRGRGGGGRPRRRVPAAAAGRTAAG